MPSSKDVPNIPPNFQNNQIPSNYKRNMRKQAARVHSAHSPSQISRSIIVGVHSIIIILLHFKIFRCEGWKSDWNRQKRWTFPGRNKQGTMVCRQYEKSHFIHVIILTWLLRFQNNSSANDDHKSQDHGKPWLLDAVKLKVGSLGVNESSLPACEVCAIWQNSSISTVSSHS